MGVCVYVCVCVGGGGGGRDQYFYLMARIPHKVTTMRFFEGISQKSAQAIMTGKIELSSMSVMVTTSS